MTAAGPWVAAGSTGGRMVKQGYAFVRAYNGRVRRRVPGVHAGHVAFEYEACWHNHRSPSAARKCAERAAARWNRSEA